MTPEQNIFAASIRRFVNDEILPHYETWEKAEIFPRMLWNRLGEEGLLCVDIPEEYGGAGADFTFSMLIQEIFNKANCPTVGGAMMVHSDIVAHYILNHGTAGQRAQYLPAMVRATSRRLLIVQLSSQELCPDITVRRQRPQLWPEEAPPQAACQKRPMPSWSERELEHRNSQKPRRSEFR